MNTKEFKHEILVLLSTCGVLLVLAALIRLIGFVLWPLLPLLPYAPVAILVYIFLRIFIRKRRLHVS